MINPTQLSQQLRMMPDQALQRMAMMYKNDPYILPMVISEDTARKKMRASAQAQTMQPQQKVVDQAIAAMAPEEAGIAALQAPNVQNMADGGIAGYDDGALVAHSEPVVRMAGGGVPGYASGAKIQDFESLIRAEAERQGIDPDVALRLFATESGGDPNAVSRKGAVGLGQLMPDAAKEMGLTLEERKDPTKNVQASVGYLKKQLDKYGSYDKALAAYNFGPGNLDKHLAKNEGQLNVVGLPRETANYLTKILPMSSAQAEEKPSTTSTLEIPQQAPGVKAPEAVPEGFFSRLGSQIGLSEEAKRNIGNIVMAPTPLIPATGIPKVASESGMLSGLAGLAERIRGPQVGRVTPEQIKQMQSTAQAAQTARAVEDAAEAARLAGAMPGEARAVAQSTEAAQTAARAAQMPSRAEQIQAASLARQAQEAARVGQVTSGAQQVKQAAATGTALGEVERLRPSVPNTPPTAAVPPDLTDKEKDKVVDAAKNAVKDPSKAEGWTNDDWLNFGFALLANRSPYFMEAVGMAGLKTLASKQEKAKMLEERELRQAQVAKLKAESTYITETKAKSELYNRATRLAQAQINALKANPQSYGLTPEQVEDQSNAIIRKIYNQLLQQEGMAGETVAAAPAQGAIPSTPPPGAVKKIG